MWALSDDGWWLLRSSNTQAVLVARCEASSEAGLDRLKAALVAQLEASGLGGAGFFGGECGALGGGAACRLPGQQGSLRLVGSDIGG